MAAIFKVKIGCSFTALSLDAFLGLSFGYSRSLFLAAPLLSALGHEGPQRDNGDRHCDGGKDRALAENSVHELFFEC